MSHVKPLKSLVQSRSILAVTFEPEFLLFYLSEMSLPLTVTGGGTTGPDLTKPILLSNLKLQDIPTWR